jgi:hypothetical protein
MWFSTGASACERTALLETSLTKQNHHLQVDQSLEPVKLDTRTCTQLRSHVGRTLVPPSVTEGVKLGLLRVASVHAVRAQSLPPYHVLHRVRAVAQQAPGSHKDVTCTRPRETQTGTRRKPSVLDSRLPQAVCSGAHARACMAKGTAHVAVELCACGRAMDSLKQRGVRYITANV